MHNPILTRNFTAGSNITKYRLVQLGDADGQIILGAGAQSSLIGVAAELDAVVSARVDVHLEGIANVEYGDTITRGAQLTSDADGKAVEVTASMIKSAVVDGAAADTEITVTGIEVSSELVAVIELAGASSADRTADFEISGADKILAESQATDDQKLLVQWRTPAVAVIGRALVDGVSGDIGYVHISPGQI